MQVPLNAYIPAKNYSQHLSMSAFPTFIKTHLYVVVAKMTICQPVLDHIDVANIVVTAKVWRKCWPKSVLPILTIQKMILKTQCSADQYYYHKQKTDRTLIKTNRYWPMIIEYTNSIGQYYQKLYIFKSTYYMHIESPLKKLAHPYNYFYNIRSCLALASNSAIMHHGAFQIKNPELWSKLFPAYAKSCTIKMLLTIENHQLSETSAYLYEAVPSQWFEMVTVYFGRLLNTYMYV